MADLSAASSCQVSANPEMAWSLLGSAEIWSLRHGHFAFDAEPELARERQAEFVRSATGGYKAAIEDSRRNL